MSIIYTILILFAVVFIVIITYLTCKVQFTKLKTGSEVKYWDNLYGGYKNSYVIVRGNKKFYHCYFHDKLIEFSVFDIFIGDIIVEDK